MPLEESDHGEVTLVVVFRAQVHGFGDAVTGEHTDGVALVVVAIEGKAARGIVIAGVAVAVGEPARQAVGADALEGELDAAGVASHRIGQHLAVDRTGRDAVHQAPLGLDGIGDLAVFAVVPFGLKADAFADAPVEAQGGMSGTLGQEKRVAELPEQLR